MTGEALLLYDGECRLCRRLVRLVEAWDRKRRIACIPYQNPIVPRLLPDVSLQELSREMLFLDPGGRRYRGSDGLSAILSLLPGGFPLRLFFKIPRVPAAVRRLYRWIAQHRHAIGCALPSRSQA